MKFRCPYCKRELESTASALCPHCGKGIRVPDHLKPRPFRQRKRARQTRAIANAGERRARKLSPPAVPFGRRPLSILLTVGILALVGAMLVGGLKHRPGTARKTPRDVAREELNLFRVALEDFRKDCGHYPDARSGLMALINNPGLNLWRGPYVTVVKPDPWHQRYVYELDDGSPLLLSIGPDGQRGTADDLKPFRWEALAQAAGTSTVERAAETDSISVRIR